MLITLLLYFFILYSFLSSFLFYTIMFYFRYFRYYRFVLQVECNYHGKGKWFPARIANVRPENMYDVIYDDGDKESKIPAERIRYVYYSLLFLYFSDFSIISWFIFRDFSSCILIFLFIYLFLTISFFCVLRLRILEKMEHKKKVVEEAPGGSPAFAEGSIVEARYKGTDWP